MSKMFKIVYQEIYVDDAYVLELDIVEVHTIEDNRNNGKVGYETFEYIEFFKTKKQLFRKLVELQHGSHLKEFIFDSSEDFYKEDKDKRTENLSDFTLEILKEFFSKDTYEMYPEIYI